MYYFFLINYYDGYTLIFSDKGNIHSETGRYHKVANVIGHTMKYHPHGDASISDAMVQVAPLGPKRPKILPSERLGLELEGNFRKRKRGYVIKSAEC